MSDKRSSGILLHLTSLPSPDGIGDMGPDSYQWIDFLDVCKCGLWQVLPVSPTGYGDSPYQSFSAFAGNPYLISPVLLYEDGLLTRSDLQDRPSFPETFIPYGDVIKWKLRVLDRAYERYQKQNNSKLTQEFEQFTQAQRYWLDDYVLFMAIKEKNGGASWVTWDLPQRKRDAKTLVEFKKLYPEALTTHAFQQFLFFRQWQNLRQYAHEKNIHIIGDLPIFVSLDSSDAWSHPELFYMDANGLPSVVAGVPPDYFSPTGQLWGNPLYRWKYHKETGYDWWLKRIQASLSIFDILRLDHFRGFSAYWEVPAANTTAIDGKWVQGPGAHFFNHMRNSLGQLPIIAEDLGLITEDVIKLREQFGLPGMKVLQFAFSEDSKHIFLPHNYGPNYVAYTGTHDNDTAWGWFTGTSTEHERDFIIRYLDCDRNNSAWSMIRAVWSSVAKICLAPMQDFLNLGNEARMNFPGKASGNWTWRAAHQQINLRLAEKIFDLNSLYSRVNIG